uniref:NADH dehydrogenase [ubiquinone] 1 alpha subcomplex subunit 3 n=1 Tax=Cebus imitator TaxID=2715852 RepID=A0A2K5PSQ9_CEBIM
MAVRPGDFLKKAWDKEPVLAVILPPISPHFKYSIMINKATPSNYPVPILEDENMPDMPSHPQDPQDPQDPSLEWLNKL